LTTPPQPTPADGATGSTWSSPAPTVTPRPTPPRLSPHQDGPTPKTAPVPTRTPALASVSISSPVHLILSSAHHTLRPRTSRMVLVPDVATATRPAHSSTPTCSRKTTLLLVPCALSSPNSITPAPLPIFPDGLEDTTMMSRLAGVSALAAPLIARRALGGALAGKPARSSQ